MMRYLWTLDRDGREPRGGLATVDALVDFNDLSLSFHPDSEASKHGTLIHRCILIQPE